MNLSEKNKHKDKRSHSTNVPVITSLCPTCTGAALWNDWPFLQLLSELSLVLSCHTSQSDSENLKDAWAISKLLCLTHNISVRN